MKNKHTTRNVVKLAVVTAFTVGLLVAFTYSPLFNYFLNRVSLVTSRGFFIPYESSLYSFQTLVTNEGSGEYWIYGEDKDRYYYGGDGVSPNRYLSIKKKDANNCPDFNPTKFETWCIFDPPQEQRK